MEKAVGDVFDGGYESPVDLSVPAPSVIATTDILDDPRLPPLMGSTSTQLWAGEILRAGENFAVQIPAMEQKRGPLAKTAARLASDHIQRRWRWQPGAAQAHFSGAGRLNPGGEFSEVRMENLAERLRETFGEITSISSVLFDSSTGQLIFAGDTEDGLEPLNMDDFIVALRAVYVLRQDPAVSIGTEPSGIPELKRVRYDGGTANTSFGQTMFAADYALKTLSIGRDSTRTVVRLEREGFKNVVQWTAELDDMVLGLVWNSRVWFVPGKVDISKRRDGRGILVGEIPVVTLSDSRFNRRALMQKGVEEFARYLTENFDLLASTYPSVAKLPQLAQLVAVTKWMRDHRIPVDAAWMEDYPLEWVDTPVMVRSATMRKNATGPMGPVTLEMEGGVSFREPNDYGIDEARVERVESEVLASRPAGGGAASWSFKLGEESKRAVAMPTRRSRSDGALRFSQTDMSTGPSGPSLVRYYSSFQQSPGLFGPGWNALPYALLFRREMTGAPGETAEPGVGDAAIVVDRANGSSQEHVIISAYSSGTERALKLNNDGTLTLSGTGRAKIEFDAQGRLLSATDRSGRSIRYRYGPSGLRTIEGGGERIELQYEAGRVASASDLGGRRVSYHYDGAGDLVQVEDLAGRRITYGYDDHRLVEWDWGRVSQMQARYDELGRVTEFVNAEGTMTQFAYDAGKGQTTISGRPGQQPNASVRRCVSHERCVGRSRHGHFRRLYSQRGTGLHNFGRRQSDRLRL